PDSSPDSLRGKQLVAGLIPPVSSYNHGIFLYKPGDPSPLQLVIEVGGNSASFAFDNMGNLWYASYDFSTTNQIYMWTAGQIRDAVKNSNTLVTAVAACTISTPHHLGGNDVERDAVGNMYFSLNNGDWPYTKGQVVRVRNNGSSPWPSTTTTLIETLADYDWTRSLAFDGPEDLATHGVQEASNRLYLDMDQGQKGVTMPTVVGSSTAGDADEDGVPDALDNCWQTQNLDQADSDTDGFGDVCEGDCDGNGKVDDSDLPFFAQDFGSTSGSSNGDLDGDGDEDGSDLARFAANLNP
ncbi:MAG: thrombospondin type 3 repeat-containing protein, partial [Desulfobacteraceae bacterium]|nr:thrombospondin type 3 repeat-containing protein [Desulfobacteraceae bacterium]